MIRSRIKQSSEVDLTPMIDIIFQLIIFFMVVMAIAAVYGVAIKFPPPGSSQRDRDKKKEKNMIVYVQSDYIDEGHTLLRDGILKFNGEEIALGHSRDSAARAEERKKGFEWLEFRMREFVKEQGYEKETLIIQGDMKTYHGKVMRVIDCAKKIKAPKTDSTVVTGFSLVPPTK